MILSRMVEGNSDLELSDDETDKDEFEPGIEDVEEEEDDAGGYDNTDREDQKSHRPLWASSST